MDFNSTRSPDGWCSFLILSNSSKGTSAYYQVTLTACVVTSLMVPMTVAGNAFILAAIWKNPSLRTPSYVLLAGLSLTDFCSGLLSQPFYVVYKLAELAGERKVICITGVITQSVGYFFSSLTVIVMTLIAVERWLHMSRRTLLTVRRVATLYITSAVLLIVLDAVHMYGWYYTNRNFRTVIVIFVFCTTLCFVLTAFAYYKVYRIIRHHQSQIRASENPIDMEKYKKSVFTILYILALFLLSYVPYVGCLLVVNILDIFGTKSSSAAFNVCGAIVFFSSFVNPLLFYWRIKDIRHSVASIAGNLLCKKDDTNRNHSKL